MSYYGKKSTKKKPTYFKSDKMPKSYKKKSLSFQPKKITVEKKNIDLAITAGVLPAAGVFSTPTIINQIRLGTGSSNRIGREVSMKSIVLKHEALTPGFTPIRNMVVYDKSPSGGSVATTDILVVDAFTGQINLDNKDRFVVLIDIVSHPGGSNSTTEEFRKIDLPTVFKSDTGAVADFSTGTLYHLCSASSTLAAPSTFNCRVRARYTDC